MKPLTFTEADIHAGSLILVNAAHPLAEAAPVRCVPVSPDGGGEMLAPSAAAVLRHIFTQSGCGTRILPDSGARTRAEQERLYADSLRDNGEEFTRKYVALPGCSEHETGLAIDLGINEGAVDFIRPAFPYDGIAGMFRAAAPRCGFIERYPRGKEAVTGIAHEPWHFRYVGCPHAGIMAAHGLTLEEYIAFLWQHPVSSRPLHLEQDGRAFTLGFIPAEESGALALPDDRVYDLSGNNVDGMILTIWEELT